MKDSKITIFMIVTGIMVLAAVSLSVVAFLQKGSDGPPGPAGTIVKGPAGEPGREIIDPISFSTTSTRLTIPKNLADVAFGNSRFVYVTGTAGVVWWCTDPADATTWTASQFGLPNLVSVTFFNGQFYALAAVANSPCVWTSSNGDSWTLQNVTFAFTPSCICNDGTNLVVVGGPVGSVAQIFTSTNGTTWTSRTSNGGNQTLNWVHSSSFGLVAVGTGGVVVTSTDAITWTARTSNTVNALNRVTSSGTLLVAVGASGTIITTTALATAWTAQTSRATVSYTSVARLGSRFVATSTNVISTSTDGVIWTHSSTSGAFNAVGYGNSTYVALHAGTGGGIMTGSSLRTLTPRYSQSTSASTTLNCVLYMPAVSRWVVAGSSGFLITSDDNGVTWTSRTSNFGTNAINGLILSASTAIAFGAAGNISTSTDGITWTARTPVNSNALLAGAVNPFVGTVLVGASGTILHSTDNGATWNARTSGTTVSLTSVACDSIGLFIVTMSTASTSPSSVLTSTNATSWTLRTSVVETSSNVSTNQIVNDGTQFVMTAGTVDRQMVYTTTDGVTFTPVAALPGSHVLFSYISTLSMFVVGLYSLGVWTSTNSPSSWQMARPNLFPTALTALDSPTSTASIIGSTAGYMISTNALDWTPFACSGSIRATTATNSILLMADSSTGMLFRSVNGDTFSPSYVLPEGILGLATNGTDFWAVTASSLHRSTDGGLTWTQVRSTPVIFFSFGGSNCIAYSGSAFVAIGPNMLMSSPDGLSWTSRSTMSVALNSVAWDPVLAKFVTLDSGVVSLGTPDGATWSSTWIGPTFAMSSPQVVSDGKGVLLVKDGTGSPSLVSLYKSTNGTTWNSIPSASAVSNTSSSLSFANGYWFLTGGNGGVEYASSNFKWFRKSLVSNSTLLALSYFNQKYVFASLATVSGNTYHTFTTVSV